MRVFWSPGAKFKGSRSLGESPRRPDPSPWVADRQRMASAYRRGQLGLSAQSPLKRELKSLSSTTGCHGEVSNSSAVETQVSNGLIFNSL